MRHGLYVIFACSLALGGCSDGGATAARVRLESAVDSGATSFDFAFDPAFQWDRMYVFGCYSSRERVETDLGFPWPGFWQTSIESSDSVVLVVFVKDRQVIAWYEQPRSIELGYLDNKTGYDRLSATFAIKRDGGRVELRERLTAEN